MKKNNQIAFSSALLEVIDRAVSLKRKNKNGNSETCTEEVEEEITDSEREEVLGAVLKKYNSLEEKRQETNGKVLLEYQKGLIKMTEEMTKEVAL